MFSSKTSSKETEPAPVRKVAPSVISSDVNLLGNIVSDGLIDFDGSIHGNIHCQTLVVRQHAKIHGEVKADTVQVGGLVKGTIEARSVVLQQGGEVEGTIIHEQITVEEGATIDGKLKKMDKSTALLEQPAESLTASGEGTAASTDSDESGDDEDSRIMEHIRLISTNE